MTLSLNKNKIKVKTTFSTIINKFRQLHNFLYICLLQILTRNNQYAIHCYGSEAEGKRGVDKKRTGDGEVGVEKKEYIMEREYIGRETERETQI